MALPDGERRVFAVTRTLELLDQAIAKRRIPDVPYGVFLSGGVDSTVNAALMTRQFGSSVRTFTVGS